MEGVHGSCSLADSVSGSHICFFIFKAHYYGMRLSCYDNTASHNLPYPLKNTVSGFIILKGALSIMQSEKTIGGN